MKISQILKDRPTISFEVFPPKNDGSDISSIYSTIDRLASLDPDFISVTYGAGGSTRIKTVEIAFDIKRRGVEPVAHLTCKTLDKSEALGICRRLKEGGVENILVLRGDDPKDPLAAPVKNDFEHASDLVKFIEENFPGTFCISGARYPEVHPQAESMRRDLQALKIKADAGAQYLVTQLFYDNSYYYRLVKEARKIGITQPILAGIMPAVNPKSLIRTANMCGASIPYNLSTMLQAYYDYPQAMREIGINYAASQIIDLVTNGVDGIHIYTMNRPRIAKAIFDSIPTVLKELRK